MRHQGGSWFPVDTNATIWCFLSKNVQDLPLQKLLLGFIIAKIHYSTSHHKGWFDIDTAPSLVIAEVYHCINDSPQYLFVTVFDTNKYMIPWDCITKQLDKNRILIIKMICLYSKNSKQNFKKDFWRAKTFSWIIGPDPSWSGSSDKSLQISALINVKLIHNSWLDAMASLFIKQFVPDLKRSSTCLLWTPGVFRVFDLTLIFLFCHFFCNIHEPANS